MQSERRPTLYVVHVAGPWPDPTAARVIDAFARCGFQPSMHRGSASAEEILKVSSAEAACVLLCGVGLDKETRLIVKELRKTVQYVLAVGSLPENSPEGDPGQPYFVDPDRGEEHLARVARFVFNGILGRDGRK
jgi:hypothetical protein